MANLPRDDHDVIHPLVESRLPMLRQLCVRHRVGCLELFGSATGPRFDPQRSDLDFLVDFPELEPGRRFSSYFDLKEDLEALFDRPVDLVMSRAIQNPYFLESIGPSRILVYAA